MAKELPYFKFFCSEWSDGDITLEDYKIQGLFINICSYYWSNNCNVDIDKLKKKFRHSKKDIDYIIDENLIKVNNNKVEINFLIEQLYERGNLSNQNSINAKMRWHKTIQENECESNANASNSHSESDAESMQYREDKKKEEKKRKEFNEFWNKYPKKTNKKGCEKKFLSLAQKDIDKILETIDNFISFKPFKDYIHPNPSTYLNQERWNDEIPIKNKRNDTYVNQNGFTVKKGII